MFGGSTVIKFVKKCFFLLTLGFLKIWLLSIKNTDFPKVLATTSTWAPLPTSVLGKENTTYFKFISRRKKKYFLVAFIITRLTQNCQH